MVKPLRSRIQEIYQSTDIPWYVIERDYLQSWILVGLSQVPLLLDTLVFKGGTALRKCYFGDYRFSEDLDFRDSMEFQQVAIWSMPYGKRAASRRTSWKDTVPQQISSASAMLKDARIREIRKLSEYGLVFLGTMTR